MPTPDDVIAYLAQAGLNPADIMYAVQYLDHHIDPGDMASPTARAAITRLGEAGLDFDQSRRVAGYLSTGRDPAEANAQQAPARVLAEDPAYLAYQRALGVEDAQDNEATTSRAEALRRATADQLANLTTNGEQARRSIDGNFEARGVYRSGAHETRVGEQRADEGRQASALQTATAGQVSDLQQQLAQRRAARQRGAAEQSLNTANNLYLS